MPAFDPATCGRECVGLSRLFFEMGLRIKDQAIEQLWEAFMALGNQLSMLEAARKMMSRVYGSSTDLWPGTLYDKLEAGANITLGNQAPAGTTGRAAKERIVRISSTTGAHAMLDGDKHSDTGVHVVSRGSIIVGNDTPSWSELVIGGANYVLTSDGTDASWSPMATHNLLDATQHPDTVAEGVTRGSLIYGNSTPKWDELLIKGTSTLPQFLYGDGTDAAWGDAKMRCTATDTTPRYLDDKLEADEIWLHTYLNPSGVDDQNVIWEHIGPDTENIAESQYTFSILEDGGNQIDFVFDAVGHLVSAKGEAPWA